MTTAKTARWLDLLAFLLQHHFPVTREEIFEKVKGYLDLSSSFAQINKGAVTSSVARGRQVGETARRRFERDKDELRALGISIETVSLDQSTGDEAQLGYRLKASAFYLPYFELTRGTDRPYPGLPRITLSDAELDVLDRATRRLAERTEFPLAAAASSARRKLAFDLPLDRSTVEQILAAPIPTSGRQALRVLQQAVSDQTSVSFHYYSLSRDTESDLTVEPWALFFQWSNWYCVGHVRHTEPAKEGIVPLPREGEGSGERFGVADAREEDSEARVFRVDRIRDVQVHETETFSVPGHFDVRSFLGRPPWEFGTGPVTPVHVRFAFPESRWVLNQRLGSPVDELLDDGGAIVSFEVRNTAAFLRWLLTFSRQANLLKPAALAAELENLRKRVAALYEKKND